MTLYVRTNYVPITTTYLTAGKLYRVFNLNDRHTLGEIVTDSGNISAISLGSWSAHIEKEWEQVTLED